MMSTDADFGFFHKKPLERTPGDIMRNPSTWRCGVRDETGMQYRREA